MKHFLFQAHEANKLNNELVRYLAPSVGLFEGVGDDDLVSMRVIEV